MNKAEAIAAMQAGHKVTHRYFDSKEWMTMQGDLIVFEDCVKCEQRGFWAEKTANHWQDGYSLWVDNAEVKDLNNAFGKYPQPEEDMPNGPSASGIYDKHLHTMRVESFKDCAELVFKKVKEAASNTPSVIYVGRALFDYMHNNRKPVQPFSPEFIGGPQVVVLDRLGDWEVAAPKQPKELCDGCDADADCHACDGNSNAAKNIEAAKNLQA